MSLPAAPEPAVPALAPLPPDRLRHRVDPATLDFATTADLEAPSEPVGQERAVEALRFGLGMRDRGYHLFVLGPPGTGRHSITLRTLERRAAEEPVPPDWVYVHDFSDPRRPRALPLPAGLGRKLAKDMDAFVSELRSAIPAAFESEDYRVRRESIAAEHKEQREKLFQEVADEATQRGCVLVQTPTGMALAPAKEGEVLSHEDFHALPKEQQESFHRHLEALQDQLKAAVRRIPLIEREQRQAERELDRETARLAIGHLVDELRRTYSDHERVLAYLEAVREDVLEHADRFRGGPPAGLPPGLPAMLGMRGGGEDEDQDLHQRYRVNLLVDHEGAEGAPVVYCDRPRHHDLVGRIEHMPRLGALVTHFLLVRGGALHRANGGYLVLDALRLLTQPLAWETLKRTLRSREVRIESLADQLSLVSTVSLEPETIPLDVQVVVIGDRRLYYLLSALDEDFPELFKVAVDFDERTERSAESLQAHARLVAGLVAEHRLRALEREAVARVLEESSRLCGDGHKLSTRVAKLLDLLRESDHTAGLAGRERVLAEDVDAAVEAARRRLGRPRERLLEAVRRERLRVELAGERVGQLNGLSVVDLGGFAFGLPSRITARARMGRGEVLDIEREVELGGPTHSKGVLILSGFLRGRYARDVPLSLAASLVFEQSYGMVDGDSASLAELCALLSAVAEVPLSQALAVTGSIDQHGRVQPVGGVDEKIEGFFDACGERGLTGDQGVLVPASNVDDLMLRPDVVAAAAAGRFRVFAVETLEQALGLLSGLEPGERGPDGRFPADSFHGRVEARLEGFAEQARTYLRARPGEREP
jgi:lon-related putative ATP-dependent protease